MGSSCFVMFCFACMCHVVLLRAVSCQKKGSPLQWGRRAQGFLHSLCYTPILLPRNCGRMPTLRWKNVGQWAARQHCECERVCALP